MRIRLALAVVAALAVLSACTQEEIDQAIAWSDAQAEEAAERPPAAEVIADCNTARVIMSGWSAGALFAFGYGSQPPMQIAVDANGGFDHTFTRAMDTGDTGWALWHQGGVELLNISGSIDCDDPVACS